MARESVPQIPAPVGSSEGESPRPAAILLVGAGAGGHLCGAIGVTVPAMPDRGGGRHALAAYAPALLWAAFLLWLGGRSDVPSPAVDLPLDKLAHLVLYGILGWLAATGRQRAGGWPAAPLVALLATACGVIDELHQRTVPGRSAEVADAAVDALAVVAAFAFVRRRVRRRGKDE